VPARIALLDGDSLAPGAEALVQIVADRAIGALHGDRFILRDQSAQRTIGGGVLFDPWPPARGRRRPERLANLRALDQLDAAEGLKALVAGEPGWVDMQRFARMRNLTDEEAAATWTKAGLKVAAGPEQPFGFSMHRCSSLCGAVVDTLSAHHKKAPDSAGLEAERLRLATTMRLPPPVFSAILSELLRDKAIEADGPWLRLPGHSLRLTPADETLWSRIQPLIRGSRFQPPRVRDFADTLGAREDDVRQLLRRLAKMGQLVQVAHDHFFLRSTLVEMIAITSHIAAGNPGGTITVGAFRDKIGSGRKVAIQILEFLDRAGITVRNGDLRTLQRARMDRFGATGR
jgi:selenocysteine-specific elongation factor